jgi:hypothetical protein
MKQFSNVILEQYNLIPTEMPFIRRAARYSTSESGEETLAHTDSRCSETWMILYKTIFIRHD